ncbi:penicillin-binding protein 2 [Candidatus Saccharibacteria bacterium]|nr:penicillin-binding protein 2 [Candidatus Saccharibacteria bacterium]
MNIFGDFYDRAYGFRSSKKEVRMRQSEDWSAAIMAGSSEKIQLEEPIRSPMYILLLLLIVVFALALLARLSYLQIITGQQHSLLASGNRVRTTAIAAPRGAIYDRNGVVLARNNARFDLVVIPAQLPLSVEKRAEGYTLVAQLTGKTTAEVKTIIESKGLRYSLPIVVSENISRDQALNIEERHNELVSYSVDTNPSREYLDGSSLAPFLGYIGRISAEEYQLHPEYRPIDSIGKTGLEKSYESDLRGIYGKEQTEVDATGLPVRSLARVEPQAGNNLILSIDKGLQDTMQQVVKSAIETAGSNAGAAIAVDPRNGQVLGAVNYPSYDGNLFAKGITQAQYEGLLGDPSKPLFNRVASGGYPIGSTVKPFISTAALQEGVINSTTTVQDKGHLDVPNIYNPSIVYVFKGWKPEGLGTVNVLRAITWSSDIFFYIVGGGFENTKGLGPTRLTDWYKRFGFGKVTGADIGDESSGFVPTPETKKKTSDDPWSVGDTYNISIGQGDMRATPLQLAMATAAIANGGTLYKPHFASEVRTDQGVTVRPISPEVILASIASPATLSLVKQGMEGAVESGTACCSLKREVPVKVAGKTGTAETSSQGFDSKNPVTKPHAWFTAYAPADNPKIVLVVLVEHAGEGAEYAVPAAKDILKYYFSTPRN